MCPWNASTLACPGLPTRNTAGIAETTQAFFSGTTPMIPRSEKPTGVIGQLQELMTQDILKLPPARHVPTLSNVSPARSLPARQNRRAETNAKPVTGSRPLRGEAETDRTPLNTHPSPRTFVAEIGTRAGIRQFWSASARLPARRPHASRVRQATGLSRPATGRTKRRGALETRRDGMAPRILPSERRVAPRHGRIARATRSTVKSPGCPPTHFRSQESTASPGGAEKKIPASAVSNSSFELTRNSWNPPDCFRRPIKACRPQPQLRSLDLLTTVQGHSF